jgi:hypothetical protein
MSEYKRLQLQLVTDWSILIGAFLLSPSSRVDADVNWWEDDFE